jgi:hypothetical protein
LKRVNFNKFATEFGGSDFIISSTTVPPQTKWFLQLQLKTLKSDSKCIDVMNRLVKSCNFWFATATSETGGGISSNEVGLLQLMGDLAKNQDLTDGLSNAAAELTSSGEYSFKLQTSHEGYQLKARNKTILWTKDWKALLKAAENDTDRVTKRVFLLERVKCAFSFAVWMLLLWDANWFTNICSCSFRCIFLIDDAGEEGPKRSNQHVYSMSKSRISACERCDGQAEEDAPGQPLEDRLRFLGLLLAELILGRPIDAYPEKPADLCWEVGDAAQGVETAIKFCFGKCNDPQWTTDGKVLRVGQIETFISEVLEPIQAYYDTIKTQPGGEYYSSQFFEYASRHQDSQFGALGDKWNRHLAAATVPAEELQLDGGLAPQLDSDPVPQVGILTKLQQAFVWR